MASAPARTAKWTDRIPRLLHQPWLGGRIGSALAVLVGLSLYLWPIGKGFRDWSYDLPFLLRSQRTIEDVVVVYLDEQSFSVLHQAPEEFDRALHARLLDRLKADGAKMVVFDILFIDTKKPLSESDF